MLRRSRVQGPGGKESMAKKKVAAAVKPPAGYRLQWSGEYEYLVKTEERLKIVIPLTLAIIFIILYLNTKSWTKTVIVLLAVVGFCNPGPASAQAAQVETPSAADCGVGIVKEQANSRPAINEHTARI